MAYLVITGTGTSSLSVAIGGLDPEYAYTRTCKWYLDGILKGTSTISIGSSSYYYTFYGLNSGETYFIEAWLYNPSGDYLANLSTTGTTDVPSNPRPSNWSWTTSELAAFNNQGSLSIITYQRWNAFLDRVSDFRTYKYVPVVPSEAYMTSSDKVLTATRFNLAREYIGGMVSTGLPTFYTGDTVVGTYFITLTNALNSVS